MPKKISVPTAGRYRRIILKFIYWLNENGGIVVSQRDYRDGRPFYEPISTVGLIHKLDEYLGIDAEGLLEHAREMRQQIEQIEQLRGQHE